MSRIGIDMLNVEKGDAFVVELHDDQGGKFVFAVDGGTSEKSGEIISHVQNYHNGQIDLAISTHPDTDHIGGLIDLFSTCRVSHLILNDPRDIILESTLMQRARANLALQEVNVFRSAFERIDELKEKAIAQGTQHHTLFASATPIFSHAGWSAYILSPSDSLFRDIWMNEDVVRDWFSSDVVDVLVASHLNSSILDDPSIDTKPVNNSSIVLLIEGYGRKYLFTGDAGKRALYDAARLMDISKLSWLDVPHHGSRRNLDTQLISHFTPEVAYISSPGTSKHPRHAVVKALQKTGSRVYSTCEQGHVCHQIGLQRHGWSAVTPWKII